LGFGSSPVKTDELEKLLEFYPDRSIADLLLKGFKYVFKLNYTGPRSFCAYDNLLSFKKKQR
jgi:hypothetical protein